MMKDQIMVTLVTMESIVTVERVVTIITVVPNTSVGDIIRSRAGKLYMN